jgi:L,D-peptidoglycan transpeptidase YkuD (ErfK/YbiS/YcfS/YnhG family)
MPALLSAPPAHQLPRLILVDRVGFSAAGRRPHLARLRIGTMSLPCRIGRTGTRHAKREGDGATPACTLRPVRGFWRQDRRLRPRCRLPMRPIRPGDGWCEVPGDRNYNRLVRKPYAASHEDMMRADALYDVVVELDWNRRPRRQGRGSAIFLHLARPDGGPTAGCIGIPARYIDRVVACLTPQTRIVIR